MFFSGAGVSAILMTLCSLLEVIGSVSSLVSSVLLSGGAIVGLVSSAVNLVQNSKTVEKF